jgi:hypothetical protein
MNKVKITREVVIYIEEEVNVEDFLRETESARLTEVDQLDELGHFGFTIFSLNPKLNRETGYNSITFGGQEHTYNDDDEREAVKNKLIKHMATEHNTGFFDLDVDTDTE